MKKSLFAIAATTAITGVAQAQSSVTVYGILDAGYIGYNTSVTTTNATGINPLGTVGGIAKTTGSQFGQSAEQSSRLGFKGTEDLGGGSSAFFTVEFGLNPQLGNLSGSSAANPKFDLQQTTDASGSAIDNRQSFVGLKKNGLGQFAFGRQYTAVFNAAAATSPGQMNNMMGDAIYSGSSSAAAGPNYYLNTMTNRADNQISLNSDSFAGFKANAFYAMNNANSTLLAGTASQGSNTQGGNVNWGGWGLGADYTWNKLFVNAAYQSFTTKYDNSVMATGSVLNLNGAGPTGGQAVQAGQSGVLFGQTNQNDKQMYAGSTYDFGILKGYLQYINRTIYQNNGAGGIFNNNVVNGGAAAVTLAGQVLKRTAYQVGARSYITPTIESWASFGIGTYTAGVSTTALTSGAQTSFNMYQLGTNYYLSKRTNLYAIYGASNAYSSVQNNGTAGTGNNYALGLRHTF